MDERLKKLLANIESLKEENLSMAEVEMKIKKFLCEAANIAETKASTLTIEENVQLLQEGTLMEETETNMKEIVEKINNLRNGRK